MMKIATHDGVFHADEVFALAVLKLYFEKDDTQVEIVRTRDLSIISKCDVAVDVGGEYDKERMKFDHHQKDKPGKHNNGLPYASFGLVWKDFGDTITSSELVREMVETRLVSPIDAIDSGVSISTPIYDGVYEFGVGQVMSAISAVFGDDESGLAFERALEVARLVILGEIAKAEAKIEGEMKVVEEIQKQKEPDILILDSYVNWEVAVSKCKNIKLVVYPDKESTRWCIQVARDNLEIFGQDRINFPENWRGLSNSELVQVSGVFGSLFCHTAGFFAVANDKESALELAQKTINIT